MQQIKRDFFYQFMVSQELKMIKKVKQFGSWNSSLLRPPKFFNLLGSHFFSAYAWM